jgi:hypothetical protein
MVLFTAIIFSTCTNKRNYDFSLKNTLSIFLLNNGKDHYFCIPVQYIGDYQIENFEFNSGYILIGDYEILLKRDEVNISVYLNEAADLDGNSDGVFNLVYSEENSRILISKMGEPLTIKHESDENMNYYYIFIEKFLKNAEIRRIINEYEKGNIYSKFYIEYDLTIDNEEQPGNGIYDDFELQNGPAIDSVWFPPNMDFFRTRYLFP